MSIQDSGVYKPQVKVCGLTDIREAVSCEELGVDAIGFVFYPKSPRNLTEKQARGICRALGTDIQKVGVFVNEPYDDIIHRVEYCGLTAVQLHGRETPDMVEKLKETLHTAFQGCILPIDVARSCLLRERQNRREIGTSYAAA